MSAMERDFEEREARRRDRERDAEKIREEVCGKYRYL
jgi:hypothetical protein